MASYRKDSLEVETFALFLSNQFDAVDLMFYLFARSKLFTALSEYVVRRPDLRGGGTITRRPDAKECVCACICVRAVIRRPFCAGRSTYQWKSALRWRASSWHDSPPSCNKCLHTFSPTSSSK